MSSRNFNIFMCLFGTAFGLLLGGCSDTTAPNDPIAAETLAIVPIEGGMGAHTVDNSMRFTLKIGGPATDLLLNGVALFGQQLLKNGDKGRTLVATAATERGFNPFVSFLTDGTSDRVGYYFFSSGGGGRHRVSGGVVLLFGTLWQRGGLRGLYNHQLGVPHRFDFGRHAGKQSGQGRRLDRLLSERQPRCFGAPHLVARRSSMAVGPESAESSIRNRK